MKIKGLLMIDNDENTVGRKHCGWGGSNYVYNEVFKSKQNKLYVNKVSIIIMIRLGNELFWDKIFIICI